jgi:hypothetical protein
MQMNLYRQESSDPKHNAQRNLAGRTHYVDDDTLRFHKARVISSGTSDRGLLFWLIESVAIYPDNSKRGFRYVIFDLFGTVLDRPNLEHAFRTSEQTRKAMWDKLNEIDAVALTLAAVDKAERDHKTEMDLLRSLVAKREEAA